MTTQTPRELPHRPSDRDQAMPVARLGSGRGESAARAGAEVYAALMVERMLLVVVADDSCVYAVDPAGHRAQRITERRPEWIVGTYTRRCGTGAIARDIREHLRICGKVAA